jgi:hypothetical protein
VLFVVTVLLKLFVADPAQTEAQMDSDPSILEACTFKTVLSVSIPVLSGMDTAGIYEQMAKTIGGQPSIRL